MEVGKNIEDFEGRAFSLTSEALTSRKDEFHRRSLAAVGPEITRNYDGEGGYYSEIGIYFQDEKGIVDVLEFFVVRENRLCFTLAELSTWLDQQLDDVLGRRDLLYVRSPPTAR